MQARRRWPKGRSCAHRKQEDDGGQPPVASVPHVHQVQERQAVDQAGDGVEEHSRLKRPCAGAQPQKQPFYISALRMEPGTALVK
jgi:hypothetical protein